MTASPVAFDRSQTEQAAQHLGSLLGNYSRGVIIAGPEIASRTPTELAGTVLALASQVGWPVLADIGSTLRSHPQVLTRAELLTRSLAFTEHVSAPEVVLRLGGPPVSKGLRLWMEAWPPAHLVVFDPEQRWDCLLYTSPSPRDATLSRMPSSA